MLNNATESKARACFVMLSSANRSFAELTNLEFKPEIGTWPWAPVSQVNISTPEDGWHEEWTSDDFMALPELVAVAYENQEYNPKLQYLTGVARDDASYLLCKSRLSTTQEYITVLCMEHYTVQRPIRRPVHLRVGFSPVPRPSICQSLFEHVMRHLNLG